LGVILLSDIASVTLRLPRSVYERVKREACKAGLSLEEYVLDLILQNLDPTERAVEYIEVAKTFLDQAKKELARNNVREAAEKLWGASALAVKAYAEWREGRRLTSHKELWEYKRFMEKELGEWVYNVWAIAQSMHTCFYEGWCTREDIEKALPEIIKFVEEVEKKIK